MWKKDFIDNGYSKEINLNIDNLICPETAWLGESYDVYNGYSNKISRNSMHIEIIRCHDKFDKKYACKSESYTSKFLDTLYFTQYILTEQIDFLCDENIKERPVRIQINFWQQF